MEDIEKSASDLQHPCIDRKSIMEEELEDEHVPDFGVAGEHRIGLTADGYRDSIDSILSLYTSMPAIALQDSLSEPVLSAKLDDPPPAATSTSTPDTSAVSATDQEEDEQSSVVDTPYVDADWQCNDCADGKTMLEYSELHRQSPTEASGSTAPVAEDSILSKGDFCNHDPDATKIVWDASEYTLLDVFAELEVDIFQVEIKTVTGDEDVQSVDTKGNDGDQLPGKTDLDLDLIIPTVVGVPASETHSKPIMPTSNDDVADKQEDKESVSSSIADSITQLSRTSATSEADKVSVQTDSTASFDDDATSWSLNDVGTPEALNGGDAAGAVPVPKDDAAANSGTYGYLLSTEIVLTGLDAPLELVDRPLPMLNEEKAHPEPEGSIATTSSFCQWLGQQSVTDCVLNFGIVVMLGVVALGGHVVG